MKLQTANLGAFFEMGEGCQERHELFLASRIHKQGSPVKTRHTINGKLLLRPFQVETVQRGKQEIHKFGKQKATSGDTQPIFESCRGFRRRVGVVGGLGQAVLVRRMFTQLGHMVIKCLQRVQIA